MSTRAGLVLALAAAAAGPTAPPPGALCVRVAPALDPRGGVWSVQLFEESAEGRKPVDERNVDVRGRWETRVARRGAFYRVRVKTEAGAGWWADARPFEWDGTSDPRDVRTDVSAFRARLVLGKKPLSARVTFTDHDGLVSVPFASGTDGSFDGLLPRAGWWSVDVASDHPHFRTTLDVKVDPVFRDGTPPDVEIRVVSKAIQGEIVDIKNVSVPVASLHVSGGPRVSDSLKVEGGAFRWERVVDGWMSIYATSRGPSGLDQSPRRSVRVAGGWVDPGFVALEIRPTYVLKGRAVLPSDGPAAGARLRLLSSPFYENHVVPGDGRFRMTVRGGGESACLLVVDPSKAARLVSVPASESEQDVPIAVQTGTLSLDFTPRGERGVGALIADGCKLSWYLLKEIPGAALTNGATAMTASFRASAGAYALCGLEPGDFDEGAQLPADACVSGVLPPGGTLALRLNP